MGKSRREVAAVIGDRLEHCTIDALTDLQNSGSIGGFRRRLDSKRFPDLTYWTNELTLCDIECKNWQRFDKPTRNTPTMQKAFKKLFTANASNRILLISYFNPVPELRTFVESLYTHIIELGLQVDPTNYSRAYKIVKRKLGRVLVN